MYIHIYVNVHMYMHIYIDEYMYIYIDIHTYMYVYEKHTYIFFNTSPRQVLIQIDAAMAVENMHIQTNLCMFIYLYTYMYIYI